LFFGKKTNLEIAAQKINNRNVVQRKYSVDAGAHSGGGIIGMAI
jgi:hypothetical protein